MASRRSLLRRYMVFQSRDEVESLGDGASVVRGHDRLGAAYSERGVGGDLAGECLGLVEHVARSGPAHRFTRPIRSASEASMSLPVKASSADVTGADDPRQALEGAEIGNDRDLRLAHGEVALLEARRMSHARHEVDATADAVAVHGRDHRDLELGDGRYRSPACRAPPHRRGRSRWLTSRTHRSGDAPPNSFKSRPTLKCGPRAAMTRTLIVASLATAAAASGRSRQKARPSALRASARSSQSVATCRRLQRQYVGLEHRTTSFRTAQPTSRPAERSILPSTLPGSSSL